jgi:small subunit ribosomal protein S2
MPRKKKVEIKQDVGKEKKQSKKKELLERAKKLEEEIKTKDIKKDVEEKISDKKKKRVTKKGEGLLVPLEEYVKAGIHLGTKVVSGDMRGYVYRRRADGLAILNTNLIDEKLKIAIKLISQYEPQEIVLVCKREAGWQAAEKFSKTTGIRVFTKKYPAGIITNSNLEDFFEPSLLIICDSWLDKNAIHDALLIGIPIVGLCDTNNPTRNLDLVIPSNNKSSKTLGLVLWILAQGFCKAKGMEFKAKLTDFSGEYEEADVDKK